MLTWHGLQLKVLQFLLWICHAHWLYLCIKVFLSTWVIGIHYILLENKYASKMKQKDFLIQKNATFSFKDKLYKCNLESSYSWHHPHATGCIPAPRNTQATDAMSDGQKNNPAHDSDIPAVRTGTLPGQYDTCWATDRTFCMDCTGGALPSEHLPPSQAAERPSHVHCRWLARLQSGNSPPPLRPS